jgi:HEAT repeat protein
MVACFAVAGVCAGETAPAEKGGEDAAPEQVIRQRFLLAYQTAQTPERKVETVAMLRGLKEKDSLRLLVGMLGDHSEVVRGSACGVMAATPDPEGYFVKPLMGTLTDSVPVVRTAAAEALANATMRGEAIKALAFAILDVVGSATPEKAVADAQLVDAYDRALQKLTGSKTDAREARAISNYWMDYWKKNGEDILAKDKAAQEHEPPPRPANLPKDSLDK